MLKHRGISSRYSARQYMSSKMNLIVNHRPERRTCLAVLATIAFATLSCHDQPTAPRALPSLSSEHVSNAADALHQPD